jgi:orotate phosphoribosyltransferase
MDLSLAVVEHKPAERPYDINIKCVPHLHDGLHPEIRQKVSRRIITLLRSMEKRNDIQFDAIAARGLSGFLFAPIVAMALNKTLLMVRKGERCHSGHTVEGDYGARNYIIIDDFISSGNTISATIDAVAEEVPTARCVGMVHYSRMRDDDRWLGKSYADRVDRAFYNVRELYNYCRSIKYQDKRIADKIAQRNSIALMYLAQEEKRKRGLQPKCEPLEVFKWQPLYAFRTISEILNDLADAAKAGA